MRVTLCYAAMIPGHKPKYGLQPLGVLYIAAYLKGHGHDVSVIDADIQGLTIEATVERILATAPEVVGFSMMTPQLMSALASAAALKDRAPNIPIVMGGAHLDSTKGDIFEMASCFDAAVHGEGEEPMLELVENFGKYGCSDMTKVAKDIDNAVYRNADGEIVTNPARTRVKDLDAFPSVDYDLIDLEAYSIPTMAGRYVLSMMLSRGCPFKCTFCDAPITMGKKLRFWSIARVLDDIRYYKNKYGVTNFVFKDSTFTANKKWAAEFCQALIDADLNIKFRMNTRANLVPGPLLDLLAKAGCYVINFGVESGHPEILKRIEKEVDLEEVVDAFERCRKLGIRTYATFLMGNPGETAETAQATIDFSKRVRPSLCMFFVSTAYPGTPMYDDALKDGTVTPRWWAQQKFDPKKNSAFQQRWGWTDAGGLKIPGFDSEFWQRKATREWYFRPAFVWDTAKFTAKNPFFAKHLVNLGMEMIPFYKLRNLVPSLSISDEERNELYEHCPSLPNPGYRPAAETGAERHVDGRRPANDASGGIAPPIEESRKARLNVLPS